MKHIVFVALLMTSVVVCTKKNQLISFIGFQAKEITDIENKMQSDKQGDRELLYGELYNGFSQINEHKKQGGYSLNELKEKRAIVNANLRVWYINYALDPDAKEWAIEELKELSCNKELTQAAKNVLLRLCKKCNDEYAFECAVEEEGQDSTAFPSELES